jgi:hypothetical protein
LPTYYRSLRYRISVQIKDPQAVAELLSMINHSCFGRIWNSLHNYSQGAITRGEFRDKFKVYLILGLPLTALQLSFMLHHRSIAINDKLPLNRPCTRPWALFSKGRNVKCCGSWRRGRGGAEYYIDIEANNSGGQLFSSNSLIYVRYAAWDRKGGPAIYSSSFDGTRRWVIALWWKQVHLISHKLNDEAKQLEQQRSLDSNLTESVLAHRRGHRFGRGISLAGIAARCRK